MNLAMSFSRCFAVMTSPATCRTGSKASSDRLILVRLKHCGQAHLLGGLQAFKRCSASRLSAMIIMPNSAWAPYLSAGAQQLRVQYDALSSRKNNSCSQRCAYSRSSYSAGCWVPSCSVVHRRTCVGALVCAAGWPWDALRQTSPHTSRKRSNALLRWLRGWHTRTSSRAPPSLSTLRTRALCASGARTRIWQSFWLAGRISSMKAPRP